MENSTDAYVLVSTGTFECPVEIDGSLLLSTLQGLIPHANGLSYVSPETNRTRVIRCDKHIGKLYPPTDGWGQRVFTVSFAHTGAYGCLRAPLAMERYDRATRTFRESVDAVERLFDISYESEQQTENQAVGKLKQEIARLRSKNKDLETDKRRLELELEEKDKKILSLLTEVPGPESPSENADLVNQVMRLVHEKENELTRVLVERDQLKNQLGNQNHQNGPDSDAATMETVGDSSQEPPSPEKDAHIQTEWLQNQWNEAKLRIQELEQNIRHRDDALAEAIAAQKAMEEKIFPPVEEMQQLKTVGGSQAAPELEERQREINELQSQVASAQEKIQNLENQLEESKTSALTVANELEEAKQIAQEHAYRMSEMQASLSWKEAETTNMRKELKDRDATLTRKNEELEGMRRKCQHLETTKEKSRNRENAQPETEGRRWQVHEFEANAATAGNDNRVLHDEIRSLKDKILSLEQELQNAKTWRQNTVEDSEYAAVTTTKALQASRAYNESDRDSADNELHQKLVDVTEKCKVMETELRHLRDNETQLKESLIAAKRELDDSRWRHGELETMVMGGTMSDMPASYLDESKGRISELLKDINRHKRQYDEALWRISKAEAEVENESKQLQETRSHCQHLQNEINSKNDQLRDAWDRIHSLESRLHEIEAKHPYLVQNGVVSEDSAVVHINREYERVQHQLNDANNHMRWLDEQLAHYKHLFHDTGARLNQLQGVLDSAHRHLWDAFVIRREPHIDRHRWNLSMWHEGNDEYYVRIWYELDAPKAKQVYLATSYYNWECLLLMSWHEHQKWGVWVDAPKGRHEFSFLVDGVWKTSEHYPKCYNDYGSENNWRDMQ